MQLTLKALRINKGLTQKQVAQRVGVSTVTIGKWERYETYPDVPQFFALANIYDCSVNDIFLPVVLT